MIDKTDDFFDDLFMIFFLFLATCLLIYLSIFSVKAQDINTGLKWKEIKSEDRFRIFYNNDLKVTCFTFQDTSALSCVPSEFLRKSEIKK